MTLKTSIADLKVKLKGLKPSTKISKSECLEKLKSVNERIVGLRGQVESGEEVVDLELKVFIVV